MVSISVDEVSKSFGAVRALDRVSLHIDPGEIFFLLGPSGCGKTTLLRLLAGFHEPDQGRVFFDGADVTRTPAHKRGAVMMFQSYALWPHLNVAKNIAFGLEERKVPKPEIAAKVEEALRLVHLEGLGDRGINQLSGGQQQRVALARALVVRPHCLLLDEPLSNLDAKLRQEMRGEIQRICRQFGLTAIYVTHDQKEALAVADRMAILDAGRVAQVGSPLEVYRNPLNARVAEFIGETNFLAGVLLGIDGPHATVDSDLGHFVGRITDATWRPEKHQPVLLSIRPESFVLTDTPPKGPNMIDGHIEHGVYLGEVAQYRLRGADNSVIHVSEINPARLRPSGEAWIHAQARPDDVVVLRHPTAAS